MYSIRFQTTSDARLPPPDLPVNYTWDRLEDLLAREIGPGLERLLAEPVVDVGRAQTHWHVTADRDPVPLTQLEGPDRDLLFEKLIKIRAAVEARAVELESKSSENSARQGAVLRLIVATPDESCVWSLDDEPLLTCWGRAPAGSKSQARRLVGVSSPREASLASGRSPASTTAAVDAAGTAGASADFAGASASGPPVIRPNRFNKLAALTLWVVFIALVAFGYLRLLAACGVGWPGARAACLAGAGSPLGALRERNDDLRRGLRDQQARIAGLRPCASEDPVHATAPDRDEIERRRREQQVSRGRLDVTLAWNGHADLDLHVVCPSGEISYSVRSACGGALDHDANSDSAHLDDRPVEHATWASDAPPGRYQVVVVLYDFRDAPPQSVPFRVAVRDGDTETSYEGVIATKGERVNPVTFTR
jgi:hypothetical protein